MSLQPNLLVQSTLGVLTWANMLGAGSKTGLGT